jgi:hypothetical protein
MKNSVCLIHPILARARVVLKSKSGGQTHPLGHITKIRWKCFARIKPDIVEGEVND